MQDFANFNSTAAKRSPWNKGKLTGAKPPLLDPVGATNVCRGRDRGFELKDWLDRYTSDWQKRFKETDMPMNELSVAPRRAVKIGLIIAMILFVASLVMRTIDIYQTHQSISPTAIASLALGALGVVMAAGAFFYAVLRRK
jgi:hypothetical protein